MSRRILERIQDAVRAGHFDLTAHAVEEMAEDSLDLSDLETAILGGALATVAKDDPRGPRHIVHGLATDGEALVAVVCRFTGTGRCLIITVYELSVKQ